MKRSARAVDFKPDISFSTPRDNRFPTPQEYDEAISKRGHFWVDKPRLSVGQIIFSVFCIIGICAALFFAFRYFFVQLTPEEGLAEAYGPFAAKLIQMHNDLYDAVASGDQELIVKLIGIWSGLALMGLFAGSADLLLGRILFDNPITYRFGFRVNPTLRFLPSITATMYMLFRYIAEQFVEGLHFTVDFSNFSIKGEGYTWEMWVTEGCYVLIFFAVIFVTYETFANSGPLGMIVRLPLAAVSNGAVIMLLFLSPICVIVITVMFVLIKAIGIILSITLPDTVRYYRE